MGTYPECKFYLDGGKCSHEDAPNPRHSYCIGKVDCGAWEDSITYKTKDANHKDVK